ncbi:mitogen-activated protein kinase kinase kinase 4 isoform X2 [Lycorma delicatula]
MQLLRGSERDLKLDFSDIRVTGLPSNVARDERVESMPQLAIKVESCNRFRSLTSRLVSCKNVVENCKARYIIPTDECLQNRVEFYETFSKLIRMGNCDNIKRQMANVSQEEALWQNELNDLIWLELQAWHADRTPQQQDLYLCQAREDVHNLLNEIINYKFKKRVDQLSSSSSDSGIHFPPMEDDLKINGDEGCDQEVKVCNGGGCLKMSCPNCFEDQNCALRDVEVMLNRLESAESLYPSSKAFAAQYPLYLSDQFTARVKAMCLWYNMTKHHRLTVLILARQLLCYTSRSGGEMDPNHVKLECLDKISASEWQWLNMNMYNMEPVDQFNRYVVHMERGDTLRIYRKYIEDVLKVRGLRKALKFLEKIHNKVLRKAKLTLEKPSEDELDNENGGTSSGLEGKEEDELKRYGCWSEEAQALNLPSYRPTFLFLSHILLNVINEFLLLRLEKKPAKPSAMSIRQLTKELKDGLQLAVLNRQRYLSHIKAALWEPNDLAEEYLKSHLTAFDVTVQNVLELYLEYLQQWVQLVQQERQQKNILEEEWSFSMASSPHIPGGHALVGSSFCRMASSMVKAIGCQLKTRVSDLMEDIGPDCEYNKQAILSACRELQCVCQETRDKALHVVALSKTLRKDLENDNKQSLCCNIIADSIAQLKREVLNLCEELTNVILEVEKSLIVPDDLDESDKQSLQARYREVLHQFFKFGFEYLKEVSRLGTGAAKSQLCRHLIVFAHHWMHFVKERCERGRGLRPRWANHGLDFLMTVCDPHLTNHLTDEEFEELKSNIDECISHVIGTATPPATASPPCYAMPRSRGASPCPSPSQRPASRSSGNSIDLNRELSWTPRHPQRCSRKISRSERVENAINELDQSLEGKLRANSLIGNVVATTPFSERHFIRPRTVNFSWQRGMKIGQGRFGKVYTAVNNHTGELMAVKEIVLQPNDRRTIQNVALEIKIFEGINHEHLVRYYGVEIHKDEMLIFMELCTQGTLESLVAATESGLPEPLVRRYTNQLVKAVATLHQHSIVHRDIKTANIFLTAEGNCLKLGDFGSAVKIKAHTTVPGELQGFVGTQAYMAPEVFMRSNTEGHGRAADIWSLGCVLNEMASGKRPWAEYDSNYQIMFKVGMGETPEIPSSLSEEGAHFASLCLKHDAKERASTMTLLQHPFLRVDGEDECLSCTMPSILEDYLKLGIKR